jgi:hypothetical protein
LNLSSPTQVANKSVVKYDRVTSTTITELV